jgi:hypothetical protein
VTTCVAVVADQYNIETYVLLKLVECVIVGRQSLMCGKSVSQMTRGECVFFFFFVITRIGVDDPGHKARIGT